MESVVPGEDISPEEMEEPGWATIRRRQASLKATPGVSPSPTPTAHNTAKQRKKGQRPSHRQPPEPLPPGDIKIVLRPRGGLALASLPLVLLADHIQHQAGVPPNGEDQVRVQAKSNFVVVSTPDEARAARYANISTLIINGKEYNVAAHVSAPANTSTGIIFNVPESDTAEHISQSIFNYNPQLKILDVRRLNTSSMVQILFDGPHVPYWVRYRAATYRCKPFRRKTEACTRCWNTGHRQDVCPGPQTATRCARCGAIDAPEQHPCTPRCIVCGGGHVTGSSECQQRFRPRKTFAMAASTVPDKDHFPPLPQREEKLKPPKQDCGKKQQQAGPTTSSSIPGTKQRNQQVGSPRLPPSAHTQKDQLNATPPNSMADIIRELRTIRLEISSLKAENAALKQENMLLKARMQTAALDSDQAASPNPPKRKAPCTPNLEEKGSTPPVVEQRVKNIEQILVEQKAEYTQLHQILLGNLTTLQSTIDAIRAEMHNNIQQIVTSIEAANAPVVDITDVDIP